MYQHHINTQAFAYTHTLMAFDVRPKVSLLLLVIEIGGIGWCLRTLTSNRPMNEIDQQQYKRYKNEEIIIFTKSDHKNKNDVGFYVHLTISRYAW